jgi:hypothetical protein
MAYYLTCKVEIGKYTFDYVESVETQSSWQELGDTCTIKLPKFGKQLEKNIRSGDIVKVYLGYNGDNRLEFEGYVVSIGASVPFEIRCEDAVYLLKRHKYEGKLFQNTTLENVLDAILNSFQSQLENPLKIKKMGLPDVRLGNIRIGSGLTYAEILQKLKEDYFFVLYFRPEYLYVGLPYLEYQRGEKPELLDFFTNVVDVNRLSFVKKEDLRIKVKAVSLLGNNQKIEIEVGDHDGELRTLNTRAENDKAKLKQWAESMLQTLKYDGYKGEIVLFGMPFLRHSQSVHLKDVAYPDRQGVYVIDRLKTSFGRSGFRRNIELGKKI